MDMASPAGLTDQEHALLDCLRIGTHRVLTRTELAREIGLRADQRRRVDVMLINVRKALASEGLALVNVRSRGWMVAAQTEAATTGLLRVRS